MVLRVPRSNKRWTGNQACGRLRHRQALQGMPGASSNFSPSRRSQLRHIVVDDIQANPADPDASFSIGQLALLLSLAMDGSQRSWLTVQPRRSDLSGAWHAAPSAARSSLPAAATSVLFRNTRANMVVY
jgi:hypothetical protein